MKVSVSITTYNHEPYIAQALDGVLAQKTDFDFEILVGEDDSSDGTRQIVEGYRERYPDKIRLFLHDPKDKIYIDGKPTGRYNFCHNIEQARGKYIALLEGDDYWTAPDKLQAQVDFLEAHPDVAVCFHAASRLDPDGSIEHGVFRPPGKENYFDIEDLLRLGNFIPTASTMFRSGLFGAFPPWFYRVKVGDWPLHILNAMHGKIYFLDRVMSMYRVHSGSYFSSLSRIRQMKIHLGILHLLRDNLGPQYKAVIGKSMAHNTLRIALAYEKERQFGPARRRAWQGLFKYSPDKNIRAALVKLLGRLYLPLIYRPLRYVIQKARGFK